MNMVYATHIKVTPSLESDFVTLVEQHIATAYRVQLQKYTDDNGRFEKWTDMRDYLLKSHKSCSTIFQELQRVSTMPMKQNESVREFSARVKQISDDAQTVISAKYKE